MLTARLATLADAAWLLRLRNDPATVAASRVQAPVTAHDHVAWLERTLDDSTRRLMIAMPMAAAAYQCAIGEPFGTYRLDGVGGGEIEVSLTVAPEHRTRGLAREIIELASRHAVREGADVLVAEIRRDNIPSFVAFFRSGFMITGWREGIVSLEVDAEEVIRRACPLCHARVPHHTNSASGIGRADDRHPVYDIHVVDDKGGVGLTECAAGDLWLTWEGARARRKSTAGSAGGSRPPASTNHEEEG
mgnify:CR=1 FL=1